MPAYCAVRCQRHRQVFRRHLESPRDNRGRFLKVDSLIFTQSWPSSPAVRAESLAQRLSTSLLRSRETFINAHGVPYAEHSSLCHMEFDILRRLTNWVLLSWFINMDTVFALPPVRCHQGLPKGCVYSHHQLSRILRTAHVRVPVSRVVARFRLGSRSCRSSPVSCLLSIR